MEPLHRSLSGADDEVSHSIQKKRKTYMYASGAPWGFAVYRAMAKTAHLSASPETRSDKNLYSISVRLAAFSSTVATQSNARPLFKQKVDIDYFNTLAALEESFAAPRYQTRVIETSFITKDDVKSLNIHHWMEHTLSSLFKIIFCRCESSPASRFKEKL